jgi:hypothetical protein
MDAAGLEGDGEELGPDALVDVTIGVDGDQAAAASYCDAFFSAVEEADGTDRRLLEPLVPDHIPVATARRLADDAIIKLLLTDSVDVTAVVHAGRTIPAHLRSALEERDQTCWVPGCDVRRGLEIDHRIPWAQGGPTTLDNLARLCNWHHYQKTNLGYRLQGRPGNWTWHHPHPLNPTATPRHDQAVHAIQGGSRGLRHIAALRQRWLDTTEALPALT